MDQGSSISTAVDLLFASSFLECLVISCCVIWVQCTRIINHPPVITIDSWYETTIPRKMGGEHGIVIPTLRCKAKGKMSVSTLVDFGFEGL